MYSILVIASTICHVLTLFVSLKEPFCIVMPTEYSYMTTQKSCLNGEFQGDLTCPEHHYPRLDKHLIQATHIKIGFYNIRCESTKVCCTHTLSSKISKYWTHLTTPIDKFSNMIIRFWQRSFQCFDTSRIPVRDTR